VNVLRTPYAGQYFGTASGTHDSRESKDSPLRSVVIDARLIGRISSGGVAASEPPHVVINVRSKPGQFSGGNGHRGRGRGRGRDRGNGSGRGRKPKNWTPRKGSAQSPGGGPGRGPRGIVGGGRGGGGGGGGGKGGKKKKGKGKTKNRF
jgi:hypothetical protein